ncbi:nitrate ABC transporter permease [Planotetraspora silvatica]|uniref:Nitrate ABC transporter permease n=1 Tax=Planotetraspora silvatica TaxID=234614 RepID=A0A8J3XP69_9ACTN|nr:ABC transporter permease [Planotetraspora silvatica]GII43593.1 nitrate ABC transporter permease [Planotetraspora silvatica]
MSVMATTGRRWYAKPAGVIVSMVVPVAAVLLWWFASLDSTSPFFPSLQAILSAFQETWLFTRVGSDVVPSLGRMLAGYGIAVVVGVGLGILFGRFPLLHRAFNPALQFCRALPATALVPVSIVLMGIGTAPKVALIAFVTVFPVMLNTIDGVRAVDEVLEDVSRSFRLTRLQRVFHVQLPAAAPQIVSGMRIALSVSFVLMVVTELVAATDGIGYVTLQAQQSFQVPQMWAGMLLLGILGVLFNGAFVLLERRLLRWYSHD